MGWLGGWLGHGAGGTTPSSGPRRPLVRPPQSCSEPSSWGRASVGGSAPGESQVARSCQMQTMAARDIDRPAGRADRPSGALITGRSLRIMICIGADWRTRPAFRAPTHSAASLSSGRRKWMLFARSSSIIPFVLFGARGASARPGEGTPSALVARRRSRHGCVSDGAAVAVGGPLALALLAPPVLRPAQWSSAGAFDGARNKLAGPVSAPARSPAPTTNLQITLRASIERSQLSGSHASGHAAARSAAPPARRQPAR